MRRKAPGALRYYKGAAKGKKAVRRDRGGRLGAGLARAWRGCVRYLGMVRAVLLVRRREAIDAAAAHCGAARRSAVSMEDTHAPRRHVDAGGGRGGAEGGEARALLAHPVEVNHEVVQVELRGAAQLAG